MNPQRVIIIGGGLGGLFTGALLTKEGYRVTVLEQNPVAGGGLQTFTRAGVTFETGMHTLGGLRPGGSIHKLCHYLGILDGLRLRDVDTGCMDVITYLSMHNEEYRMQNCQLPTGNGQFPTFAVPSGREAFTDYFARCFPGEAEGVRRYVEALYRLAGEVDFFYLRSGRDDLFAHSPEFLWPASGLISHYIKDERLRDLLAYMNPMYGGVYGHTPAYIHALINVLYIDGPSRFVGGSQQMADALAGVIAQGGGQVVTSARVTSVSVSTDRQCTHVTTADGHDYRADLYISAIHPARLVSMTTPGAFTKAYTSRVTTIPNTCSAFTVYIKLRPGGFPYINHTCYFQDGIGRVWHHADYDPADPDWPHGFMYMTPASSDAQQWATTMIVNCLMPFSAVSPWQHTTVGHRGPDYLEWKQRLARRVLYRLEQLHPGFHLAVDQWWAASPLTIRDYYGQPEGALYGVRKDCHDIVRSQLPIATKVRNLLLTGQNINLHGICGVPLTAVNTVEAIVGRGHLVDKINKAYSMINF